MTDDARAQVRAKLQEIHSLCESGRIWIQSAQGLGEFKTPAELRCRLRTLAREADALLGAQAPEPADSSDLDVGDILLRFRSGELDFNEAHDTLEAAIRRVSPLAASEGTQAQWQPIETAPQKVAVWVTYSGEVEKAAFIPFTGRWVFAADAPRQGKPLPASPTAWQPIAPKPAAPRLSGPAPEK